MGLLDRCCLFEKPILNFKHLSYTVTSVCVEQGHFQRGSENRNSVQPECKLLIDDGKNICGAKEGLAGQICKTSENTNLLMWMVSHFVIQQQGLCKKYWNL